MRLPLTPERVDLWVVFTEDPDARLLDTYRALLSTDERAREQRFHFARDRRTHVIARALLRTSLSHYADVRPADWRFTLGPHGKPAVAPEQAAIAPLSFNLSHTDGLVGLAVRHSLAVGVDVENISRVPSLDVANRFFARDEAAALQRLTLARQQDRFFEQWTLKEAYVKARGCGLSLALDQFSVGFTSGAGLLLSAAPGLDDAPGRWRLWQLRPSANHVLAVCAERAATPEVLTIRRSVPLHSMELLGCGVERDSDAASDVEEGF